MTTSAMLAVTAFACWVACVVYEMATRPPLIEVDDDEIREFIRAKLQSNATARNLEARAAARATAGTYYDLFQRIGDSKGNLN